MPKPEGMIWDVAHSAVMSIDRSSLAPNHGSRAGRMSHTQDRYNCTNRGYLVLNKHREF